jgi:hypothetical protein
MSRRSISRGTCFFCKNDFAKTGMSRHLQACRARQAAIAAEGTPKTKLFHLSVEGTDARDYWLHLELAVRATLRDLDRFLRDIWLECCGHLSMFEIDGQRFMVEVLDNWWGMEDRDMDVALAEVLRLGTLFAHEYDFGSTTYLTLKTIAERKGAAPKGEPVRIMARNLPPDYRCDLCAKPAAWVDVFEDYRLLCTDCDQSQGESEGLLPIVNSPRVGMCGYTGDAW